MLWMLSRRFWKGEASRITMISTARTGMTEINTAAIRRSWANIEVSREVASGHRDKWQGPGGYGKGGTKLLPPITGGGGPIPAQLPTFGLPSPTGFGYDHS